MTGSNVSSIITAVLLVSMCVRELVLWKSVKIRTLKSGGQLAGGAIGLILMLMISLYFREKCFHWLIFVIGALFIFADIFKQGLSDKGVLVAAKGRELFKWVEIIDAQIVVGEDIEISYTMEKGALVASQHYSSECLDAVTGLFKDHGVPCTVRRE